MPDGDAKREEGAGGFRFEVPDGAVLFKYMDFSKFMDLLENRRLYFCAAEYFEDETEGRRPEGKVPGGAAHAPGGAGEAGKIYLNCWSESETESYALWKIFTVPETGIAVKSTAGRLREALGGGTALCRTKYVGPSGDPGCEAPVCRLGREGEAPVRRRISEVFKSECYRYEREVRAVCVSGGGMPGVSAGVDLAKLVDAVYISPYASGWFTELVRKLAGSGRYGLAGKPVVNSKIRLDKGGS